MMNKDSADNSIRDRLLSLIAQADNTPAQLAAEMNLDLAGLSRWIMTGDNLRLLEGVARLSDVRAQMILSRYRANAALHLIGIAGSSEPEEMSRKACVDLLTTNLPVFAPVGDTAADVQPGLSSEELSAVLERLGAQADAQNIDDPPTHLRTA